MGPFSSRFIENLFASRAAINSREKQQQLSLMYEEMATKWI